MRARENRFINVYSALFQSAECVCSWLIWSGESHLGGRVARCAGSPALKKKKNTQGRFKAFSDEAIRRISWLQSSPVWFPAGTPETQKYSMTEVSSSCQMHSFRFFFYYFNNKNNKNKPLPPPSAAYRAITCGNVWMQCAGTVSFHLSNCPH